MNVVGTVPFMLKDDVAVSCKICILCINASRPACGKIIDGKFPVVKTIVSRC